jgi:hypothetical protein
MTRGCRCFGRSPATPVPLQQDAACGPSFEPFTADSRHALIYCADPTTVEALFDATPSGTIRRLSVGSAEDLANFAVDGSVVTFADGLRHTPEDQDLSATVDIKRADLEAATLAPTTLVGQAYTLYFPSGDRRRIVYTWDRDPASPGLFVLRVR